jgi:hypothetical protein
MNGRTFEISIAAPNVESVEYRPASDERLLRLASQILRHWRASSANPAMTDTSDPV